MEIKVFAAFACKETLKFKNFLLKFLNFVQYDASIILFKMCD